MTTMIRPGLLVSLKTTIAGGVTYLTRDLSAEAEGQQDPAADDEDKASVARWETTRLIADADEHERAVKLRSALRTMIARECYSTSFGLLCPEDKEANLQAGIEEARKQAAEFNEKVRHSTIRVHVLIGRIAATDEQAARAIADEVRGLIDSMEKAVRAADPKAIREAASAARQAAGMLSGPARAKVSAAIAEVRAIASEIVQRVGLSGEPAANVVQGVKLEALRDARFAVLDTDEAEADAVRVPAVAPALDMAPPPDFVPPAPQHVAPALEF